MALHRGKQGLDDGRREERRAPNSHSLQYRI